jgi:hypothetical protein
MAPAARTEFLYRELVGLAFFVFARRVITPFAAVALKSNQISHCVFTVLDAS